MWCVLVMVLCPSTSGVRRGLGCVPTFLSNVDWLVHHLVTLCAALGVEGRQIRQGGQNDSVFTVGHDKMWQLDPKLVHWSIGAAF